MSEFEKIKEIRNPMMSNKFEIKAIETYTNGCNIHIIDEISEKFEEKEIIISYNRKSSILAIMVLYIRISDPYFEFDELSINKKKIEVSKRKKKENDIEIEEQVKLEEIIDKISILDICQEGVIRIKASGENIEYAKQVLIYTDDKKRGDDFNMYKEMERWRKEEKSKIFIK